MDLKEGVMGSVLSKMSELLKEEHDLPHRAKEVLKYVAQQQKRLRLTSV